MKSFSASAGSPKNFVPPWFSSTSSWRWIAPMRRFETLPYCGRQLLGMVGNEGRASTRKILQVEQQQSLLVGDAERDVEHAFLHLVEVQQSRQQQRSHFDDGGADRMALLAEQIPEHRRGIRRARSRSPCSLARLTNASFASPTAAMPDRSPLMSAANTGTPAREKPSASTCSVTVLPVPVAPVTRPCRLP